MKMEVSKRANGGTFRQVVLTVAILLFVSSGQVTDGKIVKGKLTTHEVCYTVKRMTLI